MNDVLPWRKGTVSEFDKLFYASRFVDNLSMWLFPIFHMYNFAKDHQNPKAKPEALRLHLRQGISSTQWALSTQQRWCTGLRLEEENPQNAINLQCCCWIRDVLAGQFAGSMYMWTVCGIWWTWRLSSTSASPNTSCKFHTHLQFNIAFLGGIFFPHF